MTKTDYIRLCESGNLTWNHVYELVEERDSAIRACRAAIKEQSIQFQSREKYETALIRIRRLTETEAASNSTIAHAIAIEALT